MDTLYRIHVESKGDIEGIVAQYIPAFTVLRGVGVWQNQKEDTAVVEIYGTAEDAGTVRSIAAELRKALRQECVLVATIHAIKAELI